MATWKELSQDCLIGAKLLLAEGQWRGSLNRSYYAAYCAVSHEVVRHGVRFPHGWQNPAHDQLLALVRNGLPLPQDVRRRLVKALRRLRLARENSDYRPAATVGRADALAGIHDADLIILTLEANQ